MGSSFLNRQHWARIILVLFAALSIPLSFQNCGSQYKLATGESDLASLAALAVPQIQFSAVPAAYNTRQVVLTFSIPNIEADKIKSVSCQLGTLAATDCLQKSIVLNDLQDGDYQLKVVVETTAGIKSELAQLFRVDATAPVITVINKPLAVTNQTNSQVSFGTTDNLSGLNQVECSFDNGAFAACLSPVLNTALAQGAHSLKIRASDRAGNVSAVTSVDWQVDLVAPAITFSQTPLALTNQTTANFTFASANAVTYECQLDNVAFAACTSPRALTGLTAGAHAFRVRGTSAAGNVSDVAQFLWTVDLTPPTVTLAQMPPAITNATTATFVFSGTNAQTYECQLDNAAFTACTSPTNYANLAAGNHTFRLRGTSAAGNVSTVAMHSWQVDLTAPTVNLTQTPQPLTNQTTAQFVFSSGNVVNFECQLDNGAFAVCTSPRALTGLAAGAHVFRVRGTSAAGNVSQAAVFNWTVDLTAPVVTLTQNPPALTTSNTASFAFLSTIPATFECQLDNAAFTACPNSITYNALAAGAHVFRVRGTSAAGNSSVPVAFNWTVDLTPPVVALGPVPPLTTSRSIAISFSGTNSARFECRLDAAAFAACTSPFSLTNLADGSHTATIRSFSAAGAVSNVAVAAWVVDTAVPSVPNVALSVPALTNITTVNATFSSTDTNGINHFECSINGAAFLNCASPSTFTNTILGANSLVVRAFDNAGNTSERTVNWTLDNVAPSRPLLSTGLMYEFEKQNNATFTFSSTDTASGVASYRCVLNGAVTNNCTSPRALTGLADGAYNFSVVAIDAAGNTSLAGEHNWNVDVTLPNVQVLTSPGPRLEFSNNTGVVLNYTFTASDLGSGILDLACRPNPAALNFTACNGSYSIGPVGMGTQTVTIRTRDRAGNIRDVNVVTEVVFVPPLACTPASTMACSDATGSGLRTCRGDGSGYDSCVKLACNDGYVLNTASKNCDPSNIRDIATGYNNTCTITNTNQIRCWGGLFNHTRSTLVTNINTAQQISLGFNVGCVKTITGTVKCFGNAGGTELGQPGGSNPLTYPDVPGITGALKVSVGDISCAVVGSNLAKCWGADSGGRHFFNYSSGHSTAIPVDMTGLTDVKDLRSGGLPMCSLSNAGVVQCWGIGGMPGLPANGLPGLTAGGGMIGMQQMGVGSNFVCGLTNSGGVKCFGYGNDGQLGNNTTGTAATPVDVIGITGAKYLGVSASGSHACVLTATNTVKCWGANFNGQLGNGTTVRSAVPVDVVGLTNVKRLVVGDGHNCATFADDSIRCWGSNSAGQLGNGTMTNSSVPVLVQYQ